MEHPLSDWTTDTQPALLRIRTVTAATPDVAASERAYCEYLGCRVVERSTVPPDLAAAWRAPAVAGAAMVTLVPEGESNVFVRLVESAAPAGYAPLTTFGWNAFEIIADDVHALAERLENSPFTIIGPPRPLQFMPSIVAMQVRGPANECLYFTMESGDRETSILPPPVGFVGRTFIVVMAGEDFPTLLRWYVDRFALRERPVRQSKVAVIQQAQGLSRDQTVELSAIGMRERGNLIELDAYPTGPGFPAASRPVVPGYLPPGNAIASFDVESIDAFAAEAACPVQRRNEHAYGGRRTCILVGAAGELIELVETDIMS